MADSLHTSTHLPTGQPRQATPHPRPLAATALVGSHWGGAVTPSTAVPVRRAPLAL